MRVYSNRIESDDPRVVELFQKKQSPAFLRMCDDMLILLAQIPETIESAPSEDRVLNRLENLTSEIISAMPQAKLNTSDILMTINSRFDALTQKKQGTATKGVEGEATVHEILKKALSPHDGCEVFDASA